MPFLNDRLEEVRRQSVERERLAAVNGPLWPPAGLRDPTSTPSPAAAASRAAGGYGRYSFDVHAVVDSIRCEIVGQDDAIDVLERMLWIVRADIGDPRRPLHTALLLGPTGVGKTEIVRALARALHGNAEAYCRVDMNTLSQEHYAAALTGAPPGYVGSKEGYTVLDQSLIEGSLERPGIVLFDELEKASDQVIAALLNVLDNGLLQVASGQRTYSFRNTLVFMTSNLGSRLLQAREARRRRIPWRWFSQAGTLPADLLQRIERELLDRFPPEFVNRIDTVTVFNALPEAAVRRLIEVELERLNRRLERNGVVLELAPEVVARVLAEGYDRRFGARALRRALRREVEAPLAVHLLTSPAPAGVLRLRAESHAAGLRFLIQDAD
jgi:ATP-dependent Clp protease ATP-binding subunit ClpA